MRVRRVRVVRGVRVVTVHIAAHVRVRCTVIGVRRVSVVSHAGV